MIPFVRHHLLQFFAAWEEKIPLDLAMHRYFQQHRALGAKDRLQLKEEAICVVRYQRLLDYPKKNLSWEERIQQLDTLEEKKQQKLPPEILFSVPDPFFSRIKAAYPDTYPQLLSVLNEKAPLTIRVNTLKMDRDTLFSKLQTSYAIEKTKHSPLGITFLQPAKLHTHPLFIEGVFEVQDEGSQLLALMTEVKPGQKVLDYCAGSGGKSLTIAPQLEQKGVVVLHDIRKSALLQARKRLKRAGIFNVQFTENLPKKLNNTFDLVFVDAPCSGSGALRRSPEMRWRYTEAFFTEQVDLQRTIFEKALAYVKPGGKLLYGTCSLLPEENEEQVAYFLNNFPLQKIDNSLSLLPERGGHDGFFGQLFQKK